MEVFFADSLVMRLLGRVTANSTKLVLISYLLLVTTTFLFLHDSRDGLLVPSRAGAIEKASIKGGDGTRQKASDCVAPAADKSAARFVSFSSPLRLDLKQNLRAWPVVASGIERSPPSPLF